MKKVLSLGLILLLILTMLTACGGNSSGGSKGNDGSKGDGESNSTGSSTSNSTGDTKKTDLPPDTKVIKVGETREAEGITITLDEVWVSTYTKMPEKLPEGHVFLFPHFTITNMNEGYKDMSNTDTQRLSFTTAAGCVAYIGDEEYTRTLGALMAYEGEVRQMDTSVNYGDTVTVFNAFIVPANWDKVEFIVNQMNFDIVVKEQLNFSYVVENK